MRTSLISVVFALACLGGVVFAADAPASPKAKTPFYPQFCFGFGASAPHHDTPAKQAKLLAELGYDGYAHYGVDGLADVLKALDENGLKLFQFYVYVSLDSAKPKYDPRLKEALASLKGRETVISLLIDGKPSSSTELRRRAVEITREIADMAAALELRVAIYPYYDTLANATVMAKETGRKNVGVILSQVFYSLAEEESDLAPALKAAMPYLYAVNINGTDSGYRGKDFARLIQTLDRGTFDNLKLLTTLRELGYVGPIGVHCCYIAGDARDNLARSMEAWKHLSARLNADRP